MNTHQVTLGIFWFPDGGDAFSEISPDKNIIANSIVMIYPILSPDLVGIRKEKHDPIASIYIGMTMLTY